MRSYADTVMSESELSVPRLGVVRAEPGFQLAAAMNPFDAVGTARISTATYDRHLPDRQGISTGSHGVRDHGPAATTRPRGRDQVVDLVRRTRSHPELRIGSSVRGAIDLVAIAGRLAMSRGVAADDWHVGVHAAPVALSGRIRCSSRVAARRRTWSGVAT